MSKQIISVVATVSALIGISLSLFGILVLYPKVLTYPTSAPASATGVASCLVPGTSTADWEKLPISISLPDGTKVALLPVKTANEPALELMIGRDGVIIYSDVTDVLPRGVAVSQELHLADKATYGPYYVLVCGDNMYVNRTNAKIH